MRKLKLGLVNIMPNTREYTRMIRHALAGEVEGVDLYSIRVRSHEYRDGEIAPGVYHFDELTKQVDLDLLIVTGAPVEHLSYEEIGCWGELQEIFAFAQARSIRVFGICFGGLAIGKFLGIEKRLFSNKLFGVHEAIVSPDAECYVGPGRTHLNLALSTWALLDEGQIERAPRGMLKSLVRHPELGHLMLSTADGRFVMMLGHPEYSAETLQQEWKRDLARGIPYARQFVQSDFQDMGVRLRDRAAPILANWVGSHGLSAALPAVQRRQS